MLRIFRAAVPLMATLALAAAAAQPQQRAMRDDDIVARVNGTPIYRKAVKDLVQGGIVVQDRQPDAAGIAQMADDALQSLIALELLYQESQARGITVSDAEVDEEIARSKQRFPDAASFNEAMKANRMTLEDLRRDTRKTMAVNRLLEGSVLRDVKVTPDQVLHFYEENKEEFKHPAEVRASRILIRVPDKAPAAKRKAAQQDAEKLVATLKAGGDFAEVARERSQDPATASRGGDLGFFARGEMERPVDEAAFNLAPGQISGVITTPYGFEIIKVTERRDAGYRPLSEVEDIIREVLTKSERQDRQQALIAELKKKAKVELLAPIN
jgi:peptidyl-prolyl cis-trans isomerase C